VGVGEPRNLGSSKLGQILITGQGEGHFTHLISLMDSEKDLSEHKALPTNALEEDVLKVTQNPAHGGDHRIQFTPSVKPDRTRPVSGEEDVSTFVVPIRRRHQSVASIPQVISEKDKDRRKREKEEEKKNVNIDEHLMAHQDVAERYKTRINLEKPGVSLGLTSQQAEQLLHEHGPNVLTPPKKRHPFLKYLDCLSSLFNLLLILAGILEYILLAIDFKDNFQNVSVTSMSSLANDLGFACAFAYLHPRLIWEPSLLWLQTSMPLSNFSSSKITGAFGVIP
jgi:hypothetical protein